MNPLDTLPAIDPSLWQSRHPRAQRWVSVQGGSSAKRLVCLVCDQTIATYSAKWPMPKRAIASAIEHAQSHQ